MPVGERDRFHDGMQSLKEKVQAVSDLIPHGSPIVYCDLPLFNNFGDILIMLGTIAFLRANGIKVRDSFGPYGLMKPIKPYRGAVWLLHGGGNFGDLYPEHMRRRETIIKRHPHARIISFPQTMQFFDRANLDHFARVAAGHKDLHLLWRDRDSYELARRHFDCNNYLVPDMAHFLWPLAWERDDEKPSGDLLLIRTDGEAGPLPHWIAARREEFVDWRGLIPFPHRQIRRLLTASDVVGGMTGLNAATVEAWSAFCFWLLPKMAQTFRRHERIITSRLHGHIFACLLGRRSLLLDNSYGKNARYFGTWTSDLGFADLAHSDQLQRHGLEVRKSESGQSPLMA